MEHLLVAAPTTWDHKCTKGDENERPNKISILIGNLKG